MNIDFFKPESFDWSEVPTETLPGESGFTLIQTKMMEPIKIRKVIYSKNYVADHWCDKGHVVFVLKGQLLIEHQDTTVHTINSGMVYLVGDESLAHKAKSHEGAEVLIVD